MKEINKNQAIIKRDTMENFKRCFGHKYIPCENVIIMIDMPDGTIDLRVGNGSTYIEELPNLLKKSNGLSNATYCDGVLQL